MEEINAETVRAAIHDTDPSLEALSLLLKSVAGDAVAILAGTLRMMGQNPADMPGEFFLQSVLIESERAFKPISREKWVAVYDTYMQIKAVIETNPDLQKELRSHKESAAERLSQAVSQDSLDGLLDGDF